jgi:uncharacterized protein
MPLFAVIGVDGSEGASLRERCRAEHREYYLAHDAPIRLAGAMHDDAGQQCGSLLVFEAPDAASVRAWYEREAFFCSGVYAQFTVLEWRPVLNRLPSMPEWP